MCLQYIHDQNELIKSLQERINNMEDANTGQEDSGIPKEREV